MMTSQAMTSWVERTYDLELCRGALEARIRKAIAALAKLGIAYVEVSYDGVGDSGSVDALKLFDKSEQPLDVKLPADLDQELDAIAFALLGWWKPGWELNEGSYGLIRFHIRDLVAELDHWWRREESDPEWIELAQSDLFDEQLSGPDEVR